MNFNLEGYIEETKIHHNNKDFKVFSKEDEYLVFEVVNGNLSNQISDEKAQIEAIYAKKLNDNIIYNENLPVITNEGKIIASLNEHSALMQLIKVSKKINNFYHNLIDKFVGNLCKKAPWLITKTFTRNIEDLEIVLLSEEEYEKTYGEYSRGCYAPLSNQVFLKGADALGETFDHELMHVLVVPKGQQIPRSALEEGVQEAIRGESFGAQDLSYKFQSDIAKILTEVISPRNMKNIYKHRKNTFDNQFVSEMLDKKTIKKNPAVLKEFMIRLNHYTEKQGELYKHKFQNEYAKDIANQALEFYFNELNTDFKKIKENDKAEQLDKMMFSISRIEYVINNMINNHLDKRIDTKTEEITEKFNQLKDSHFKKVSKKNDYRYMDLITSFVDKKHDNILKCEAYKYFKQDNAEELVKFQEYTLDEFEIIGKDAREISCSRKDGYAYKSDHDDKDYQIIYSKYDVHPKSKMGNPVITWREKLAMKKEDLPRNGNFREVSYKLDNVGNITNPTIVTDTETIKGKNALIEIDAYVGKRETESLSKLK